MEQQNFHELLKILKDRVRLEYSFCGSVAFVDNASKKPEQKAPSGSSVNAVTNTDTSVTSTDALKVVMLQALQCTKCKLAKTRKQVVFGSGSVNAKLMIVGEAPGANEDIQGLPFVGEAGQLLTKMIAAININRDDAYIANVIKCRPPQNRNPEPEEIVSCKPWLQQQIAIIRPKVILGLGKFAAHYLTGIDQYMGQYREKTYEYEKVPVICTYHPAYLLRNPNDKKKSWEDLKRLRLLLDKLSV